MSEQVEVGDRVRSERKENETSVVYEGVLTKIVLGPGMTPILHVLIGKLNDQSVEPYVLEGAAEEWEKIPKDTAASCIFCGEAHDGPFPAAMFEAFERFKAATETDRQQGLHEIAQLFMEHRTPSNVNLPEEFHVLVEAAEEAGHAWARSMEQLGRTVVRSMQSMESRKRISQQIHEQMFSHMPTNLPQKGKLN